jgi:hypothetical protein
VISNARELEDATDALARLDATVGLLPQAFGRSLRARAIGRLAHPGVKGSRSVVVTSVGAVADDDPTSAEKLGRWIRFIEDEERLARGGAPLTLTRLERAGFTLDESASGGARDRLAQVLRVHPREEEAGARPAALERALAIAALLPIREEGEAAASIILCAEGRTASVRMLPFGDLPLAVRDEATASWRAGRLEPWRSAALEALAAGARRRRARCERARATMAEEEERIGREGRAAINMRRAVALLREELAITVPALADALGLSRPAAGDAIARLVASGIAEELTGRRRDRVFAYRLALTAGDDA